MKLRPKGLGWEKVNARKTELIQRCLPVESVADFGGTWGVEGGYAVKCATDFQVPKVFLIDELRPSVDLHTSISFIQGDFSSERILELVPNVDLVLAFDIILHQYGPLKMLMNLLDKTNKYIAIDQPTIKEEFLKFESEMPFLQGILDEKTRKAIYPGSMGAGYPNGFWHPKDFRTNHWLWGIPKHLVKVWLEAKDFEIVFEKAEEINKVWYHWGFVAQRKADSPNQL